jgi:hypothetical protein
MNNLVPLPYSRVAVQAAGFDLDDANIRAFLRDKHVWFETDYVVFRHGDQCAIAGIDKTEPTDGFSQVTSVEIISLPSTTHWVDDPSVDSGNPSALADKANTLGVGPSETLVVNGLYEHVCFIHRPAPVLIDVFDLSPPDVPRLLDMVRRVLAYRAFPPTRIRPHVQAIADLVRDVGEKTLLFPCGISQLKRLTNAFYLDERPEQHDWILVGCDRSRQIHRHLYGRDCPGIELCPRKLFHPSDALALMRCCMVEKKIELVGRVAFVPWGTDLGLVEEALIALLQVAKASDSLHGIPSSVW